MRPPDHPQPAWPLLAGPGLAVLLALAAVGEPWLLHAYTLSFDFLAVFDDRPALATVVVAVPLLAATLPLARARSFAAASPRYLLLGLLVVAMQLMNLRLGPLNLLNLTIPLLLLWWIADCVERAELPRQVPLLAHLLVLLGVLAMLSLVDDEPLHSLRGLLVLLPKLAMAWVLLQVLRSDADLRFVLRVLIVSSLVAAAIGLAQAGLYVFYRFELHLMDETAPRYITVFGLPMLRASGLLPNPQAYVHPLLFATMLLAYRWLADGGGRRRWHPAAWGGIVLLLLAIALSFARGPWLALLLGLLLLPAAVVPRRAGPWLAVVAAGVLLALWSGFGRWALDAYGEYAAGSADVRVELLAAGLEVLAEHPLLGVGMANFEYFSPTIERYPVHNALLQIGTEIGLPALLLFLAILLLPPARALLALRRLPPAATHRLRALLMAYLVFIIAIQGDPMAYSEFVLFVVVLLDAAARIDGDVVQAVPAPRRAQEVADGQ